MQTIYFDDRPLYLTDKLPEELAQAEVSHDIAVMETLTLANVENIIAFMRAGDRRRGAFLHPHQDALIDAFRKALTTIPAAGGFVYTEDGSALLIYRRGKWDLPKGKLDEGEDLPTCAVREVQEETGLHNVSITNPLCITYHTYPEKGDYILKESYWYLMTCEKESSLTPQQNEDIEQCKWVPFHELPIYMENAHASVRDVVEKAMSELSLRKIH